MLSHTTIKLMVTQHREENVKVLHEIVGTGGKKYFVYVSATFLCLFFFAARNFE